MTNYVKNYRKTAITKAYDLLELKANGRIDADGDYLDDEGNKLTFQLYIAPLGDFHYKGDCPDSCLSTYLQVNDREFVRCREDGFICFLDDDGHKASVSRGIFLATYEEVKWWKH